MGRSGFYNGLQPLSGIFPFGQTARGLHGLRAAPSLKDLAFQFVLLQLLQSNPCCALVHLSGGRCIMFNVGHNVLGYDFE